MKLTLISSLILSLILVDSIPKSTAFVGCQHRSFGQESTVCVCTTQKCDSLDPVSKTASGIVQVYQTSRDGDRFAHWDVHWNDQFVANSSSSNVPVGETVHEVKIYPEQKMQKIVGFGGALTDTSGYNFMQLPESLRQNLIRDYFHTSGIEYSSVRVTIGGSDMSQREYSNDDFNGGDDFNLDHFSLQQEDLKYKIPFLQMARQYASNHPLKIFGTAWSAPAWMKTNHDLGNGGRLRGEAGGPYYKAFAKYLIKFMKQYQQHSNNSIQWWGMTIANEPGKFRYNSLEMSGQEQRDFIKKDLGPELQRENFLNNFHLMIYDWNIPGMKQFAETILQDSEAAKYVAGIAYHWYATNEQNRHELTDLAKKFPSKFLLSTEACEGFGGDTLGVWHTAENYSWDIIKSLKNYVSGWIDWNLIVDMHGGPSWVNQHLNAPIIVNAQAQEYYKQPMFYTLGHFSKFLQPGSVHLHYQMDSYHPNFDLVIFERPDGGTVCIILNKSDQNVQFLIEDPRHGKLRTEVVKHGIRTFVWY